MISLLALLLLGGVNTADAHPHQTHAPRHHRQAAHAPPPHRPRQHATGHLGYYKNQWVYAHANWRLVWRWVPGHWTPRGQWVHGHWSAASILRF